MCERNRRLDGTLCTVFLSLFMASVASADEAVSAPPLTVPAELSPQKVAELVAFRDAPDARRIGWSSAAQWPGTAFGDVEFRDGSALGRLKSIREVSLVTVAEFRGSRFFFGMNTNGIVGFHLVSRPQTRQDRFVEILRTPWIERRAPSAESH